MMGTDEKSEIRIRDIPKICIFVFLKIRKFENKEI
jgi:hypothetical protein